MKQSISLNSAFRVILAMLPLIFQGCGTSTRNGADIHSQSTHAPRVQAEERSGEELIVQQVDFRAAESQSNWDGGTKYRIGPGDVLRMDLLNDEYPAHNIPVGPDGYIYFDLLDGKNVSGMTLVQVQEMLLEALRQYHINPRISVNLVEARSSTYMVLGAVHNPGIYTLDTAVTLVEALARAGGLSYSQSSGSVEYLAALEKAFLLRHGEFVPIDFDSLLSTGSKVSRLPILAGDFIYLPSTSKGEIFVLGSVNRPQALRFQGSLTLLKALAAAGGFRPEAYFKQVAIVRGSLASPSLLVVDVAQILEAHTADIQLAEGDMVFVPEHPMRRVHDLAWLAVTSFTRSVSVNEGSRLASDSPEPIGINIPVGL